jgi:hypothetical protein
LFLAFGFRRSICPVLTRIGRSERNQDAAIGSVWTPPGHLSPDDVPLLVWFSDIRDPNAALPVTVAHLSELLGDNAHLAEGHVEITTE